MTLRRLLAMHEGLQQAWWAHDAWICHVIANSNRDPEASPLRPAQLNPLLLDACESAGGGIELNPETIRVIVAGMKAARENGN